MFMMNIRPDRAVVISTPAGPVVVSCSVRCKVGIEAPDEFAISETESTHPGLVMSRRRFEAAIVLAGGQAIKVVNTSRSKRSKRLSISAPDEFVIVREELLAAKA